MHLRGHRNILKRVLIHAGASNLGLLMRHVTGIGTPRSLQGRAAAILALSLAIYTWLSDQARAMDGIGPPAASRDARVSLQEGVVVNLSASTCATGCYGARGARVGLIARGRDGLEAARQEIEHAGGRAGVCPADVAQAQQIYEAASEIDRRFGPPDI